MKLYRGAVFFAILFYCFHLFTLPIEITYDGLDYINLADVLFSDRFPQEWLPNRTPGLPIALKVAFGFLGSQALAGVLVPATMGLAGILVLGQAFRRAAGEKAAAFAILLVSLYPTLVTYQHSILTETGTFFFFALVLSIALWSPDQSRGLWQRAGAAVLIVAAGFYWRQNILILAFPLAAVHCMDEWAVWRKSRRQGARALFSHLARPCVIAVVPVLLSMPWNRYSDSAALRDVTLRQGMIRQALLRPEDPLVGQNYEAYWQAIEGSARNGNFYSGVTWDRLTDISKKIFRGNSAPSTPRLFLDLIKQHPGRYCEAIGRSILFFLGVPGVESDNRSFRGEVLSPQGGAMICPAPHPIQSRVQKEFQQGATPTPLVGILRRLGPLYDAFLVPAGIVTLLGMFAAVWLRSKSLLVLCMFPLLYLFSYAVFLVTIDRFMVPVYPVFLSNLIIVPALIKASLRSRVPKLLEAA